MRESCTSGSVRGVLSNEHPYRDRAQLMHLGVLRKCARRAHPVRSRVLSAWARRARLCNARRYWRGAPLPALQVSVPYRDQIEASYQERGLKQKQDA
jgi:hypothetical protein